MLHRSRKLFDNLFCYIWSGHGNNAHSYLFPNVLRGERPHLIVDPGFVVNETYEDCLNSHEGRLEYELCYECHSVMSQFSVARRDIRAWFDTKNPSFHPVEAAGKNSDVPSLKEPYSVLSQVNCTDCHGKTIRTARGALTARPMRRCSNGDTTPTITSPRAPTSTPSATSATTGTASSPTRASPSISAISSSRGRPASPATAPTGAN